MKRTNQIIKVIISIILSYVIFSKTYTLISYLGIKKINIENLLIFHLPMLFVVLYLFKIVALQIFKIDILKIKNKFILVLILLYTFIFQLITTLLDFFNKNESINEQYLIFINDIPNFLSLITIIYGIINISKVNK